MNTLEIKDLKVNVGEKQILKGINLTVNEGEIHAIMGPNGNGKSTLLQTIMGHPAYTVVSGSITFNGKDVLSMSVDERSKAGLFLAMQYPKEIAGVTNSDFLRAAINARLEKNISLFKFIKFFFSFIFKSLIAFSWLDNIPNNVIVDGIYTHLSSADNDPEYTNLQYKLFDEGINIIKERIPNTLLLTTIVIFMTWLVGVPLGIVGAIYHKSKYDRLLTIFSSIGMAIPSFFFAILLLILAVKTSIFPVGGLTSFDFDEMSFGGQIWDLIKHLILPVTVLFTISLAGLQRQMRANMLDVLSSDYIKFARAKGLSEAKILFKHALRNAINPMITLFGFEFAGLLSGAALTEYVFQYPGLGRLILEAVLKSDINLVMASLMMGTLMLVFGNLIADILLMLTDPRLKRST